MRRHCGHRSLSGSLGEAEAAATGVVLYGFIGGALGGLIGRGIGPEKWVDVPVVNGRVPVAPLAVSHAEERSFTTVYRWDRFPPTVPDFEAFFRAHADSLDAVEGIWNPLGSFWPIAIVRESGLWGYSYAAFRLARFADVTPTLDDGKLFMGLTTVEEDGSLEMRYAHRAPRYRAHLADGELTIYFPSAPPLRWVRVMP